MTGDSSDRERPGSERDDRDVTAAIEREGEGRILGLVDDFAVNSSHIVEVDGASIAVIRTEDGFYAVRNKCPHQGGPVGEGRVSCSFRLGEGGTDVSDLEVDCDRLVISCPWHGWPFDLDTGVHVTEPEYSIPTYDVVVEDGSIYLDL
jgi:nitrite reductase/ring-hydroxylating ferredoxin subunit